MKYIVLDITNKVINIINSEIPINDSNTYLVSESFPIKVNDYYDIETKKITVNLTKAKQLLIKDVKQSYEVIRENLFPIGKFEKESWDIQYDEYKLWENDKTNYTPIFCTELANSRGVDLTFLMDRIKNNTILYKTAIAHILGKQHKFEDKIKLASSYSELNTLTELLNQIKKGNMNYDEIDNYTS